MTTTTTPPPTTTGSTEGWRLAPPGRSVVMGDIHAVGRLTDQLVALDVKLPVEITRLNATWVAVQDLRKPTRRPVAGLRADADQLDALVMAAAQQLAVLAEVDVVIGQVERELLFDAVSWFQANADGVIDQLRPTFDRAAADVKAAVTAGIHSSTGRLGDLPDDAVKLWRAAYGRGAATSQLSAIASARVAMSDACWVPPGEGPFAGVDLSVCFNAPHGWWTRTGRSWETVADPQLLPVGGATALRWDRRPSVYADAKAEAHHRQQADADLAAARQPAAADLTMADVAGRL